jgi:prepilin-type N-terminal cleavage/methylation domain-containing protein
MKKIKLQHLDNEHGYTLVELTVAILVIGILTTLAITSMLSPKTVQRAKASACEANLRILDGLIRAYIAENDTKPTSLNDLTPRYIKIIPKEPTGGSYLLDASHTEALCSKGHTYP